MAKVLDRTRAELVELHAAVLGLQLSLGPTLAAAAGDGSVAKAAQDLDIVAQTLDGLASFLGAVLSVDHCGTGRLDLVSAAAGVTLEALSSRLAGRPAPASAPHGRGELDLF